MAENRAKHYHTIGNECIMDRMTICGEKREKYNNKHGTPYDVLQEPSFLIFITFCFKFIFF